MELFHVFFLFLVAKLRRISFCFVCRFDLLSFWIPSIFLTPHPSPCANTAAAVAATACLPYCLAGVSSFSLSLRLSFSLSCVRSQLQQNQSKERHTSSVAVNVDVVFAVVVAVAVAAAKRAKLFCFPLGRFK